MNTKKSIAVAICMGPLTLAQLATAGSDDLVVPAAPEAKQIGDYLKPVFDVRLRYEYRDQDGLESSNSITARARAGLMLKDLHGFSALVEAEGTVELLDDYNSGAAGARPFNPGQTAISDPENLEMNRVWAQYERNEWAIKAGRQRIIRNNAAFIGNVGWRQNEQTFDAAQLSYKAEAASISYVYADQVNRIFGKDAAGGAKEFEGDFHLIDGQFDSPIGKVGAYAYLMDVENVTKVGNNTVGAYNTFDLLSGKLYLEGAYQSQGNSNYFDYSSGYGHAHYTLSCEDTKQSFSFGLEYLEQAFVTPLATVHAFNGFADAFIGDRIGLSKNNDGTRSNNYEGLSDFYVKYTKKGLPYGLVGKAHAHYFLTDSFDNSYGWELDGVLVKKFNENFTGLIKAAYFFGDSRPDIAQITTDLSYTF